MLCTSIRMLGLRRAAASTKSARNPALRHEIRRQSTSSHFRVSEEVQQALAEKRPVVALETAVYTHGFPYPDNIALASLLESTVRANGGVPATIGILDGIARVGLDAEELIRLAGTVGQPGTIKVSRRDLAFACGLGSPGRRLHGGTTVAGTMVLAHMAGIKVFATGGLGGVHRGGESSMDVSADLTELGRTPVAVVSSGCKSFLDIGRTLEYLETEGVPVAAFADGRSGKVDFPGFWSRDSGIKAPMTLATEAEAAAVIQMQHAMGLKTGMLFGNPIPAEISIEKAEMDGYVRQAVGDAEEAGAIGNANTPFVLNRIKELTESRSVEANRGLLADNARRGALVAVELAKLENSGVKPQPSSIIIGPGAVNYTAQEPSRGVPPVAATKQPPSNPSATKQSSSVRPPTVFVAGSIAVDLSCDYKPASASSPSQPMLQTSNPAAISQSIGGVGQNIARAIHLLDTPVRLCTILGNDLAGTMAKNALDSISMDTTGLVQRDGARTAQYIAVNAADKSLVVAMADMEIMEEGGNKTRSSPKTADLFDETWEPQLQQHKPSYVVTDGNWRPEMLSKWLDRAKSISATTFFEPVSTVKAARLFSKEAGSDLGVWPVNKLDVSSPNSFELDAMHTAAREAGFFDSEEWWQVIDALGIPSTGARVQLTMATTPQLVDAGIPQQAIQLLPYIPRILTKLGADGVLLTQLIPAGDPRLTSGAYAPYIISRCDNGTEETSKVGGLYMRLLPAAERIPQEDIVSVNGVGDTFLGAIVAGMVKNPECHIEDLVLPAQQAAVLTLKSTESVSPELANMKL